MGPFVASNMLNPIGSNHCLTFTSALPIWQPYWSSCVAFNYVHVSLEESQLFLLIFPGSFPHFIGTSAQLPPPGEPSLSSLCRRAQARHSGTPIPVIVSFRTISFSDIILRTYLHVHCLFHTPGSKLHKSSFVTISLVPESRPGTT